MNIEFLQVSRPDLYVFVFSYLRVDALAIFNIGSVLIFIVVIYQNYKGRFIIAFFMAAAEMLIHALLASYFIGDIASLKS